MSGSLPYRAAVPATANLIMAAVVGACTLMVLFLVPWLIGSGHGWAAWLAALLAPVAVVHWALVHEAVHGRLHRRPRMNDRLGRLLAVLFLAPYDALRFGHLAHHAWNARPADRPELYDPRLRSRPRAWLVFYLRLFCGIYLIEVASGPLSLLPRRLLRPMVRNAFHDGTSDAASMADRAERTLLAPATLRRIRGDAGAILALVAASALAFGAAWPALVAALLGRAFVVSVMDNAPHYAAPLAEPEQGYDMHLPGRLGALVLNTNLHGTHHRHPNLPWTALPGAFAADGAPYAGSYLTVPWRQLRGPLPIRQT